MSFGIYFDRCDGRSLDKAERDAVRAALARWGWDGSCGSPYQIGTEDGVPVDFYASGLTDPGEQLEGGNLEAHGFSIGLCRLVLDLARAGSFVISHDGDASAIILVSEEQRVSLPADLAEDPKLMVCKTAEELEAAIEGGFDKWCELRDRAYERLPGDAEGQ